MSEDFYENYKKQVAEGAKKIKVPKDTDQNILWLKAMATKAIEDANVEKCFTFRDEKDNFGFTERYVNFLMQIAYNKGYEAARADVKVIKENILSDVREKFDEMMEDI